MQWAEESSRLGSPPDGETLIVLGAASYRVGRFQDAQDALERAVGGTYFVAVSRVLKAMTLFQLGRHDDARVRLDELRQHFREAPWEYWAARSLLREAEELIDPKPAGTATAGRPAHQNESP
jgi:hypothetical protein